MATRATYSFCKSRDARKHYVYLHHDGYPEGAARYLYQPLLFANDLNFATTFIRANLRAELTESHEHHADTEYRYSVTGSGPKAKIIAYSVKNSINFFCGELHAFISEYLKNSPDFKPFIDVNLPYSEPVLMTEDMAKIFVKKPLANLVRWPEYEGSANWVSHVKDLRAITEAFPTLLTDEIAEFIKRLPAAMLKSNKAELARINGS